MTQRLADRLMRKQIVNEDEVEMVFSQLGFEVLYPETMPFADQIRAVSGAEVIAGLTGSALYAVLVNDNPRTKVISVDTRMSSNQVLIEKIRGLEGIHILCGTRASRDDLRTKVDMAILDRALGELSL